MLPLIWQLPLGFLLAALIALAARRARSLSRSGVYGALLIGTIIFGLGGWQWAILLLTFFFSSTALTRAFGRRKRGLSEKFSKGGERDLGQALGNGGVAAGFVLLHLFFPEQLWPWLGFAGALAAVNADTWATELGVLNPHPPRLITTWKRVERGTSGGVSLYGTLAVLAGAALIALPAAFLAPRQPLNTEHWLLNTGNWPLFLTVTLAGLAGSLFDSLLGATLQAIYRCPACDKETERHPLHLCGRPTVQIRGLGWLNNDLVNAACGAFGALVALGIFWL